MARKATNKLLHKAKKSKSDETHFKDRVVYCNCDDPRISNFFKYFAINFEDLGIKKLITSCYREQANDLFGEKSQDGGFFFEYTNTDEEKRKLDDPEIKPFTGNGDFRSPESIELLKRSDVVVTNPPFSLFREYVEQLVKYEKKFLIIGNVNAITYKEIFELIKENKAWLGINLGRGVSGFIVPEHYELYGTEARIDEFGNRIVSPNNCLWLTNLDTFKRHEDILLTKKYFKNEHEYQKYDNYDGINVNRTEDIPLDYEGAMGVPITFLHKFNPDQFELIKFRKGDDEKDLSINGKCPYFRILIKNKRIQIKS